MAYLLDNVTRRAGLALAAVLLALSFTSHASAQPVLDPDVVRYSAAANSYPPASSLSLAGPRAELITGLVLLHASFPVGIITTLALGPPLFACGFDIFGEYDDDPEYQRCQRQAERKAQHAARVGMWTGLAMGVVGSVLTIDGALRVKRTRELRRRAGILPHSWSIAPSASSTVASATWRF